MLEAAPILYTYMFQYHNVLWVVILIYQSYQCEYIDSLSEHEWLSEIFPSL